MRGKLGRSREQLAHVGLIPAHAGKTDPCRHCPYPRRAHPRMCGENLTICFQRFRASGSSPRVRGKQILGFKDSSQKGLIPACAGKTAEPLAVPDLNTAHPRVCGENGRRRRSLMPNPGSSPRVRGKRCARFRPGSRSGLIPACAGKTFAVTDIHPSPKAHPRVCGENHAGHLTIWIDSGSSPRVRGKLGCIVLTLP